MLIDSKNGTAGESLFREGFFGTSKTQSYNTESEKEESVVTPESVNTKIPDVTLEEAKSWFNKNTSDNNDESVDVMESMVSEISEYSAEFDETAKKVDIVAAYAFNEYTINSNKASMMMTNPDDIDAGIALMEEAADKAANKMQKTVKASISNAKNYFSKTNRTMGSVVKDDKYQKIISEAKDLCKKNPSIGKIEVEYDNYTAESDAISKAQSSLDKIIARGKAKKNLTEGDAEEIKQINTDINKVRGNKKAEKQKTTLAKAITTLDSILHAIQENATDQEDKRTGVDVSEWDPVAGKRMSDAIAMHERLNKEMSAVNLRTAVSLKSAIKTALKKARKGGSSEAADEETNESVELFSSFAAVSDIMESVVLEFKNKSRDLNKGEEDNDMYAEGIKSILTENAELDAEVDQLISEAYADAGIEDPEDAEVSAMIAEAMNEAIGGDYSSTYDDVVTEGLVTGVLGGAAKAVGGAVKGVADTVTNADKDDATEEEVDDECEETAEELDRIFNDVLTEGSDDETEEEDECEDSDEDDDEESEEDEDSKKKSSKKKSKKSKSSDDDDEEDLEDDSDDTDDDTEEEDECVDESVDFDIDDLFEEAFFGGNNKNKKSVDTSNRIGDGKRHNPVVDNIRGAAYKMNEKRAASAEASSAAFEKTKKEIDDIYKTTMSNKHLSAEMCIDANNKILKILTADQLKSRGLSYPDQVRLRAYEDKHKLSETLREKGHELNERLGSYTRTESAYSDLDVDDLIEEAALEAGIDMNSTEYLLNNFDELLGL